MADRPIIVAGSIPSADFGRLAEELRAVDADGPDWIHIDVTDGRCVPNISFEPGGTGGRTAGEGEAAHHLANFAKPGARIHLTYPALKAPNMRLFLVVGNDGAPILGRLLQRDQSQLAARLHPSVYLWIFPDAEVRSAA